MLLYCVLLNPLNVCCCEQPNAFKAFLEKISLTSGSILAEASKNFFLRYTKVAGP